MSRIVYIFIFVTLAGLMFTACSSAEKTAEPREFRAHEEVVKRLNVYENIDFRVMLKSADYIRYSSQAGGANPCFLTFYTSREQARQQYQPLAQSGSPVFIMGAIMGSCPMGDSIGLFTKTRNILVGMGLDA